MLQEQRAYLLITSRRDNFSSEFIKSTINTKQSYVQNIYVKTIRIVFLWHNMGLSMNTREPVPFIIKVGQSLSPTQTVDPLTRTAADLEVQSSIPRSIRTRLLCTPGNYLLSDPERRLPLGRFWVVRVIGPKGPV